MALGVRPRDHVGILMHTCAEFVELFFAIAFCGGVIVPINARYKAAELAYVIENGDLVTVITTDAVADQVNFIERHHPGAAGPRAQRRPAPTVDSDGPETAQPGGHGQGDAAGIRDGRGVRCRRRIGG